MFETFLRSAFLFGFVSFPATAAEAPAVAELPDSAATATEPERDPPAWAELPEGDLIAGDNTTVLLVVGAAGKPEYGRAFETWADTWTATAKRAGASVLRIGGTRSSASLSDRERLKLALAAIEKDVDSELWIVLLGHGTDDGRTARFNLNGPDVSDKDLAEWLAPFTRPVAVINSASSSGSFVERLSKEGRVVLTATKSGQESKVTRFGDYLTRAISGTEADLDQDGQTSLLEAWLAASKWTGESYSADGRLATEHAQLDDDGDGFATRPESYRGIRPANGGDELTAPDGRRAHQFCLVRSEEEARFTPEARHRYNELELQIAALRAQKRDLSEAEYFERLESLCLEMARLSRQFAPPLRTAGGSDKPSS